nr:UDP-3-0-acyl N-acetylglucosamine deacetylase [Cavernulicola chilensis]
MSLMILYMNTNNFRNSNLFQYTISRTFSVKGIGLHTGELCQINLSPANLNKGIYFIRKDIDTFHIPAKSNFILNTHLNTSIGFNANSAIRTIEHLMASLIALKISNLRVEVYGPEIPILDGSASCWTQLIINSRIKIQQLPLKINFLKRIMFIKCQDSFLLVFPSKVFSITYGIDFESTRIISKQWFTHFPQMYGEFHLLISAARTFGILRQVKFLKKMGMVQGANLRNAWLCTNNIWLNDLSKFDNEPVKHKVLDLLGDLNLTTNFMTMKIIAYKSNHTLHIGLSKAIKNQKP